MGWGMDDPGCLFSFRDKALPKLYYLTLLLDLGLNGLDHGCLVCVSCLPSLKLYQTPPANPFESILAPTFFFSFDGSNSLIRGIQYVPVQNCIY